MNPELQKILSKYAELDRLAESGEDVVADLRKEINNLELAYLKDTVLPKVAMTFGSLVDGLRFDIDGNLTRYQDKNVEYAFGTSINMVMLKGEVEATEYKEDRKIITVNEPPATASSSIVIPDLRIEDYSDKAIVVRGDTRNISDLLTGYKGIFNARLKGGVGWIFPKKKKDKILALLSPYMSNALEIVEEKSNINNKMKENDVLVKKRMEYIDRIKHMYTYSHRGYMAPHNAVYLLTIIEGIKNGIITNNKIYYNAKIDQLYNQIWENNIPSDWPFNCNFCETFVHMRQENFYDVVFSVNKIGKLDGWDRTGVLNSIYYAEIDKDLFDLMHDQIFIETIKDHIVSVYFNQRIENEMKLVEQDKTLKLSIETRGVVVSSQKFNDFRDYLSNIINCYGQPLSPITINTYINCLHSKYIENYASLYTDHNDIEHIDIKSKPFMSILESVRVDVKNSKVDFVYLDSLEKYKTFKLKSLDKKKFKKKTTLPLSNH